MQSLFARTADEAKAVDLDSILEGQLGSLSSIGTQLSALAENPPGELGQMLDGLGGITVPEIGAIDDLLDNLGSIAGQLPTDTGELTGAIIGAFEQLIGDLQSQVLGRVSGAVEAIGSMQALIQGQTVGPAPAALGAAAAPAFAPGAADTGRQPTAEILGEINSILDQLPEPLDAEALITLLALLIGETPATEFPGNALPGITRFQQQAETIVLWRLMDSAGVSTAIADTLAKLAVFVRRGVDAEVDGTTSLIAPLNDGATIDAVAAPLAGLSTGLNELATVATSGDLSSVPGRVTTLAGQRDALSAALATIQSTYLAGQADDLVGRLQRLPTLLDSRMREVLGLLRPATDFSLLEDADAAVDELIPETDVQAFADQIQGVAEGVRDLIGTVDLEATRPTLLQVIETAQGSVQTVDDLLIALRGKLTLLFDQIEQPIENLDTVALVGEVTTQLENLETEISDQISTLFSPVQSALSTAIGSLSSAVDAFDPQAIVTALQDLVNRLASIFTDGEVPDALNGLQQVLDQAVAALERLSFKPVTDEVIAQIEDVEQGLSKIDVSSIPAPAQGALKAALSVIPKGIDPVLDAIVDKFNELLEAGPKPLLLSVKDGPERLIGEIEKLAPANLIGNELSKPYTDVLDRLAAFQPSRLLSPVDDALGAARDRLAALSPAKIVAPLEDLHDELIAAYDQLNPAQLTEPITAKISEATQALTDAIPLGTIFGPIDEIVGTMECIVRAVDAWRALLDRVIAIQQGLADPDQQVDALVEDVLTRIQQIPDSSIFEAPLTALGGALDSTQGSALGARVGGPLGELTGRLAGLDPGPGHAALVRAKVQFPRSDVEALPDSPEKAAILGFLDGFDPFAPTLAGPLIGLQDLRENLTAEAGDFTAFLSEWDALYHGTGGPFAEFRRASLSPAELRAMISEAIRPTFAEPITFLLKVVERARIVIEGLLSGLATVLDEISEQLSTLLLLPTALQEIGDALQALLDRIAGFDLSFITDELDATYNLVRGKLLAFDPGAVGDAIHDTFNQVVGNLDISALIPQTQIDALDAAYAEVLDKLRALNPAGVIVEATQPAFEAAIAPVTDILDKVTDLIEALLQKLDDLATELRQELARTSEAFEDMLQAIPLGGGGGSESAGVGV